MARSKSRNIADLVGDRGTLTLNSNNLSSTFSDIDLTGTGSLTLPVGTTSQRDSSPAQGMIRFNSTLSQFEGYKDGSWAEIGGGSSDTWTTDNFTGDGSTAAYTLTIAPSSEDNVIAFIEGVFQNPADFVVSGTTITFDEDIPNGQKVVVHSVKATVAGNNLNLDEFTGNGSNTQFTLSINPIDERNSMVYLDGVYQNKDTYSISSNILHFSTAPAASADIEVLCFTQTSINTPTSNSVSTSSLIDDSVTSAKLGHGLTLQGNTAIAGNLDFADSYRLHLGSDDDFAFFHTGGNAVIHNTTGELRIRSNTIKLQDYTNEDLMIVANSNDSVELYYNNIKKFETTNTGVTANGTVSATTFSGSLAGTIASITSATTQANSVANTTVATTAYVTNKVTELIGGAPGTLDTLNELAAAINDDANYNSTLTTALATKLPLAGGTLTGHLRGTSFGSGISATVGISGSVADLNSADLGPGYLILARDDTADAAQLRFAKNGSVHSYLETRSTGLGFVTDVGNFAFEGGVVGIGVPAASGIELSIGNASNNSAITRVTNGTTSVDLTASSSGKAFLEVGTNHPLVLATNAVERIQITAGGIVDIGKSAFSSYPTGAKLNVYGDGEGFRLDGTGNTSRSIRFRNVGTNGSSNAIIVSDGSMQLMNEDANAMMYFNSVRDIDFQVTSGNGTAGHMRFSSYNTEIMRIDGANNRVGIGTDAPAQKLEVDGGVKISNSNSRLYFGAKGGTSYRALEGNTSGSVLQLGEGYTSGLYQMATNTFYGDVLPATDNAEDLGSASYRWRNIYTGDLHLSNEGSKNDVDGTSGNWTVQEGENDLFIINNKTGKKFKFSLEEVE